MDNSPTFAGDPNPASRFFLLLPAQLIAYPCQKAIPNKHREMNLRIRNNLLVRISKTLNGKDT